MKGQMHTSRTKCHGLKAADCDLEEAGTGMEVGEQVDDRSSTSKN